MNIIHLMNDEPEQSRLELYDFSEMMVSLDYYTNISIEMNSIQESLDEILFEIWFITPLLNEFKKWISNHRHSSTMQCLPKKALRWLNFLRQFSHIRYECPDYRFRSVKHILNTISIKYKSMFENMIKHSQPKDGQPDIVRLSIMIDPFILMDEMIKRDILLKNRAGTRLSLKFSYRYI